MTAASQTPLPDYYGTLGVPPTADRETIRQAYRRLALQHHPDRGGTHEMMLRLNEAFEVLGNAARRADYDQARAHAEDAAANARAQTATGEAAGRAGDYPQNYGEFETWLDGVCADFRNAKYGSSKAYIPTIENSVSGLLFILAGAVAGGMLGFAWKMTNTAMHWRFTFGMGLLGAWLGRYLHQHVRDNLGSTQPTEPEPILEAEPNQPRPAAASGAPRATAQAARKEETTARDGGLTGSYRGTCTNTSFDPPLNAELVLKLDRRTGSLIEGSLELQGDLVGGSQFAGLLEGHELRFQTIVPGESLIEWKGRLQGNEIVGDYTARLSDPEFVKQGLGTQQGVWRCVKHSSTKT